MYTVNVYEDDIVIESAVFNTFVEAREYANKYTLVCYVEINNVPYYEVYYD